MDIKRNHIKIGNYVIQYDDKYEGFVILTSEGEQVGYGYDNITDAMEQALKLDC